MKVTPIWRLKGPSWHRGKYPSANDKEDIQRKGKVEDTCVVHAHKISVDNSYGLLSSSHNELLIGPLGSLMRGTVFSLISGQRIVSQLCLCRFHRDSSRQLIEETPFVGLFKLVHHYGGEFKIARK